MPTTCLAVVQACLSGEPCQSLPTGGCCCSLSAIGGPCTAAPNQMSAMHALAMRKCVPAAAAAASQVRSACLAWFRCLLASCGRLLSRACSMCWDADLLPLLLPHPQALLDATLDRHNKYPLHLLLESAGLELAQTKKPSRFYARFHGASALEVAVCLGHAEAAGALLAAGASVRPQAFDALVLYCPPRDRDAMAALLAGSQVCRVTVFLRCRVPGRLTGFGWAVAGTGHCAGSHPASAAGVLFSRRRAAGSASPTTCTATDPADLAVTVPLPCAAADCAC